MNLIINIASEFEDKTIIEFFGKYINSNTDGLYSQEFICPFGIKGAIKRAEIIVAKNQNRIVGALRFYRQKRKSIVSLYQFAVSDQYRGKGLLSRMLEVTNCPTIHSRCSEGLEFNKYYKKTGRTLIKQDDLGCLREMKIGENFSSPK